MYTPAQFEESRPDVWQELIRRQPLATLVTLSAQGLVANHIPMLWRPGAADVSAAQGTLVAHVARSNPLWRDTDLQAPVLAIFQGPQAYISPSWYATKAEHGKVVPTWNYAVVHVRGNLRVMDDPQWIRAQMEELTTQQEAGIGSQWAVGDAPADYIDKMVAAVVGIEIPISQVSGKWKVSQNQPAINQASVVQALQKLPDAHASAMAELVQARSKPDGLHG